MRRIAVERLHWLLGNQLGLLVCHEMHNIIKYYMNASRLPRLPVVLTKKGSVAALYSALLQLQQIALLRAPMKSADSHLISSTSFKLRTLFRYRLAYVLARAIFASKGIHDFSTPYASWSNLRIAAQTPTLPPLFRFTNLSH